MPGKNQLVSKDEILISNMLEIEAIIQILERKGITTKDEIMEEIKKLQVEMDEKIKRMSKEN